MRRTRKTDIWMVPVLALTSLAVSAAAQERAPPIIPGAHGFGMETPAGSGRHLELPKTRVIKVTNLNTEGPGSLREALAAEGPRVVVFEVSGNIDFTPIGGLNIRSPYVTVAGQTAPSPGITLKACQLNVSADDVLLQHIRVRVGDLRDPERPERDPRSGWTQWSERDCMKVGGDRVVIDHCSFSWATDENVQTRGNDLTFRQNIISEALDSARHHKGGHSRGLLIMNQGPNDTRREGQRIAVIGNLFVHNKGRNPTINGGAVGVILNNLIDDAHFAMKGDCTARRGHQLISAMGNVVKRTWTETGQTGTSRKSTARKSLYLGVLRVTALWRRRRRYSPPALTPGWPRRGPPSLPTFPTKPNPVHGVSRCGVLEPMRRAG